MSDDPHARRFKCYFRWSLYLAGVLLMAFNAYFGGMVMIAWALTLTGIDIISAQALALRYKWYGIAWVAYYVTIMIYVISVKGKIFHIPGFGLLLLVPFVPEVVMFEVSQFRGK